MVMTTEVKVNRTGYICKNCGAESPRGLGYVVGDDYEYPTADAECGNVHVAYWVETSDYEMRETVACTVKGCKVAGFFYVPGRQHPEMCLDHADEARKMDSVA